MFECRVCVLRHVRALVGDVSVVRYTLTNPVPFARPNPSQTWQRYLATLTATTSTERAQASKELSLENGGSRGGTDRGSLQRVAPRYMRALRMEMHYVKDPVKFADHVHYTLRCNNLEKALDLCRLASKSMNCVVAWNHTINWLMGKERLNDAIKVFNEMKKRAQFPDSYTYLLILRGFPQHRTHHAQQVKKELVAKAVAIYNSMSGATSKVKPAIMHTNAVLRWCSLAHDMDALWSVVSQLPEQGPNSADSITYTTLLNAIRHSAFTDQPGLSVEEVTRLRQNAVNEGRRVWQEIIGRWRSGEVIVDEQLVCAMGNLLLVSKRMQDWDDVLSLVQQTTNTKRLLAPLGSPERHTEHVSIRDEPEDERDAAADHDQQGWTPAPATAAFDQIEPYHSSNDKRRKPASPAWVTPGNATLSIVIDACANMQAPRAVTAYWDLFITQHGLSPDQANYLALLRLLRASRNSAKAAAIVQDMYKQNIELQKRTFRLALSVCLRSWKNPKSLDHAVSVVELMYKTQNPDLATLQLCMELAVKVKDGRQIAAMLVKLQQIIDVVAAQVKSGVENSNFESNAGIEVLQAVIGAIDTLIRDESIPKDDMESWRAKRSKYDVLIGQASNNAKNRRYMTQQREERHRQRRVNRQEPETQESWVSVSGSRRSRLRKS